MFQFEPNPVYLYSYPGIRAFDLNRCLKEVILPPPREIGLVIVHVGTNDASQTRVQSGTDKVAEDIIAIFATLEILYPNAEKMFSSILPRFDEDDERVPKINQVRFVNHNKPYQAARFSWFPRALMAQALTS